MQPAVVNRQTRKACERSDNQPSQGACAPLGRRYQGGAGLTSLLLGLCGAAVFALVIASSATAKPDAAGKTLPEQNAEAPALEQTASTKPAPKLGSEGMAATDFVWQSVSPLDIHPRTSLTILEQLRHNHFLEKRIDDELSSEVFDNYIKTLDSSRSYFLASDLKTFDAYRFKLDDALKRGNLRPAFEIFNLYQERVVDRLEFLLARLNTPLTETLFDANDALEIDREEAPWLTSEKALDALWDQRLRAAALAMKLNGKELSEIAENLTKRYKNRLKQAKQTKAEDAFALYINSFASKYDPHTQYFSPRTSQNFNINMSLSLEGIGAVLRSEDDYTSIVRLVTAGPADKTGLVKPSDRIVSVGQGNDGPLIDVVGWRLDDVVEMIRGPKGSIVRLEVQPDDEGATTSIVQITRDAVQLEEQAAQKKLLTLNRGGRDIKVGIIEVPTFYVDFKASQRGDPNYKSTTRDVAKLIDELKAEGVEGIVMDLRNNGGGSLQEADSLTGLFIKSGPTVQVKSARRRASVYSDNDELVAWDGPMAVLVNRLSASASEIFAGAIQDYERGLVIGSQTFGKGTVQTLIPLNRGQLKITAAKFYRISGQSTQHQGVIPDVTFPELYDVERIGESSLHDALPWDVIAPAVYPRSNSVQPLRSALVERHESRVENDPDFNYLRALMAKNKENSERTHVSLNESLREQEKAADDAWRLTLENTLRKSKGEELLADLDALTAEAEAEAAADEDDTDPSEDPLLRESGQVLLDYLELSQAVAVAERAPSDTVIQ
ncbi:MAG: carboxy terminal-processing peptidase [Pseudomonadales bacterium]